MENLAAEFLPHIAFLFGFLFLFAVGGHFLPGLYFYILAGATFLLPIIYDRVAESAQQQMPSLRGRRICLLIAHPDDEAMFFSPTVLALTRPDSGNHVRILCLSSGDADGLGATRQKELVKSAALLGVENLADVLMIDDNLCMEHFPDSMTVTWDADRISNLLSQTFAPKSNTADSTIDVLITFDSQGISTHPNHISLYHGARAFISSLLKKSTTHTSPVALYTLRTVGMVRKYAFIFDSMLTKMFWRADGDKKLLFTNSIRGEEGQVYWRGFRAMTEAHVSQMRWFRYGWILLSRYMVVNELEADDVE